MGARCYGNEDTKAEITRCYGDGSTKAEIERYHGNEDSKGNNNTQLLELLRKGVEDGRLGAARKRKLEEAQKEDEDREGEEEGRPRATLQQGGLVACIPG